MNDSNKNKKFIIFLYIFLLCAICNISANSYNQHVIFSLQHIPKNKKKQKLYNRRIHEATYELKQVCKKIYKNSIDQNEEYPHRRDTVFFVHFDHTFKSWTLYKPSFISYNQFVKLAKKIYAKYGLYVDCYLDQMITISKTDIAFDKKSLTLDEFEQYKNMTNEDIQSKIDCKERQNCLEDDEKLELETLRTIQAMKEFFFWHLEIPTTGILPSEKFDIDVQFKPLAWHFLLWDLAPKKGDGAQVAIIDTGASAFNLQEKEFASLYKKNINITVPDNLQNYGYNLVSEHGLDPIRQVAINFGHYCDHEKFNSDELMEKLPQWILELIKNKNDIQLRNYFIKNAKKEFLNKSTLSLNENGEAKLKDLLYGKYGIIPFEKKSFFNIVNVQDPYNCELLLETLPAPKIIGNNDPFAAGHGTFTQGIVNGNLYQDKGICGLAPRAHVTMIKAFNDNGTTNKTTLQAALQRAIALNNSIISMSLKITDEIDKVTDAPLKKLIDSIDYVVAASGNDGTNPELQFKEAYPAKFDSVAFDVGAFEFADGNYTACPFTQKEINIGPKFLAPGFRLFSSGLAPNQKDDSMYVFMSGTSIAVPVITGFLALVLAEFQDVFTREQILKVIYKFSMKLHDDEIWQKYIKLGTPDMRSCLLCFHVLQALKSSLQTHPELQYSFEQNFDKLVQAIYIINYYIPSSYEKQLGYSFMQNFAQYKQASTRQNDISQVNFFNATAHQIEDCVFFIQQIIINAFDIKKIYKKISSIDQNIYQNIDKQLKTILFAKKFNLFGDRPIACQKRIELALQPRAVKKQLNHCT